MVGRALIAHGRIGHDDVAHHHIGGQYPGAATGNEMTTAKGNEFIHKSAGQRRAHAGMHDDERAAVYDRLIDRIRPHLRAKHVYHAQQALLAQSGNDILEEAQDAMGWNING